MADNSLIEWTDATWNPITGCSVISPGCTNCYAMKLAGTRLRDHPSRQGLTTATKAGPVWNGQVRLNEAWLEEPLRWRRPRKIFVCAHGDLFHESVPDAWIDRVFAVMALAPQHTFQVLTKRSARMRDYLRDPDTFDRIVLEMMHLVAVGVPTCRESCERHGLPWSQPRSADDWWPLRNVWLGVSAEDQPRADQRVPELLATPAAVRFLSAEPLIAPLDVAWALSRNPIEIAAGFLRRGHFAPGLETLRQLDWVIVGGENGDRPMHPAWVRLILDDCQAAGVAFFFKQWGTWAPRSAWVPGTSRQRAIMLDGSPVPDDVAPQDVSGHRFEFVRKSDAGRTLDGATWNQFPEVANG